MTDPQQPPPSELPHSSSSSCSDHDPDSWRHVRPFQKPITFIPAGSTPSTFPAPAKPIGTGASGREVSALYLQLVGLSPSSTTAEPPAATTTESTTPGICPTCNLPLNSPTHHHTIAHQSSLPHSRPPHHLPRRHVGLKILQSSGWDPDSTLGLGTEGQGGRYPVKAVEKKDRVGVGGGRKGEKVRVEKKKLGAKEARRVEVEGKRRRERVREELGGRVEWGVLMGEGEEGGGLL
ncbi:hypothetical protein BDD12DRAFT_883966 [Trichophaea hybrida]|nr:hypothetical protein BDD12DRAFT_883966 [Trichophaea hybrida]